MLLIVATPIGNLKDITLRALDTLKNCDGIICEDTRRAAILLNNYQIKKPLYILNDFNEASKINSLLDNLRDQNIVLISDAGTPLISDPGYKLVRECLRENILVDIIPGPSAITTSLPISGLPPDKFLFLGYFPEKPGQRINFFKKLAELDKILSLTYISYLSPHKLIKTLGDMQQVFGDIEIVLAKELTKIHQNVKKDLISNWLSKKEAPRGEYVLLFRLDGKE